MNIQQNNRVAALSADSADDVLIADELERRPSREPSYASENRALVASATWGDAWELDELVVRFRFKRHYQKP